MKTTIENIAEKQILNGLKKEKTVKNINEKQILNGLKKEGKLLQKSW